MKVHSRFFDDFNPTAHLVVASNRITPELLKNDGCYVVHQSETGYSVHSHVKDGQVANWVIQDPEGKEIEGLKFTRSVQTIEPGMTVMENAQVIMRTWVCWEDEVGMQSVCVEV